MSSRRGLLTALGASLVAAGCLDTQPTDGEVAGGTTGRTSATPKVGRRAELGESVSVAGTTVTVADPRVRKAVVSPGMAHTRVAATAGQYVVVDLTVDGTAPDRPLDRDFRSVVDGTTVQGSDPLPTVDKRGYAFTFPGVAADGTAVEWAAPESTVRWTLPDSVLATLARQPAFVVERVRVPRRDGTRTLVLTVANEGERDGQFRARVSFDGFSGGAIVAFPVPAGATETYTGRPGSVLTYLENHGGTTLTVEYPAPDGLATVGRAVETDTGTGTATATTQ